MPGLTITIITHEEERNIGKCLEAIQGLADEILVVDSFSKDKTVDICNSYGCSVIQREFKGFADQKQFAVNEAKNDWILSVDADEVITKELKNEIAGLLQRENMPYQGYNIRISLCYLGRVLKHSGVGSDHKLRFFNRKHGKFESTEVHELITLKGSVGRLKGRLIHYSYHDLNHHMDKLNLYTTVAAAQNYNKGRKFSKLWCMFKFPITFLLYYFFKGGFRDGYPGFVWSFFASVYTTVKIAKTIELTGKS
ncbi:MAG: glycosyltransferase family 2 protein [Bacteroidota bacterium]